MDKLSINVDKCKGCGLCEAECGFNNAINVNNGKAAYNNNGSCIECLLTRISSAIAHPRQLSNLRAFIAIWNEIWFSNLFVISQNCCDG